MTVAEAMRPCLAASEMLCAISDACQSTDEGSPVCAIDELVAELGRLAELEVPALRTVSAIA